MSAPDRRAKLDPGHGDLSIRRQCAMLGLARSGVYRKPRPANDNELEAMRRRSVHRAAVLRRAADRADAERGGLFDRPPARAPADAADGHRGAWTEAENDQARAGTQDLSLPLARSDDRPAEPGLDGRSGSLAASASGSMSNTAFVRRMYATCARVAVEQAPEMTAAAPCTGGRRLASCALCSSPARRKLSGKPSATPEPPVTSVQSESAAPGVRRSSSLTASRIA